MSWIDEYVDFTASVSSTDLFRRWGAISAVAAALERKVWLVNTAGLLYPNIYTIFVANPGVGKTVITSPIQQLLKSIETHHTAATSLTAAALIDDLRDAARQFTNLKAAQPVTRFHSLYVVSDELGVLLPKYETEFMSKLTALYDCHDFSERRRSTKTNFTIENPQLNILAGCTPSYLMNVLPEGAWDQGFLSRCFLIFSSEVKLINMFDFQERDIKGEKVLRDKLKIISTYSGEFSITEDARAALWAWEKGGRAPRPEHPKLAHYNTRRLMHLVKLAMILSAAEGPSLIITRTHIQLALDYLIEAEFFMSDIFKAMRLGGESAAYEEAWYHLYTLYMREGKRPVSEGRLILFLQAKVPAHSIMRVIESMERSGQILPQITAAGKAYIPSEKHSVQ